MFAKEVKMNNQAYLNQRYRPVMSMKFSKRVERELVVILLIFLLNVVPFVQGNSAQAAFMKPESALHQVLEQNSKIYQFYLEVKVSVFDPEAFAPLHEDADTTIKPYAIPEKSYLQNIVFVRDEFVSIETVDEFGEALHIFIDELGGKKFSENLSSTRQFNNEDIYFPALIFFTKHLALLEEQLNRFHVTPIGLTYIKERYKMLYKVGTDTNNLQIDPNTFKVLGMQSQIQIQGRYYPHLITFSEWNKERESIPELTRYYVNSRLFKETRIINLQFRRIYQKRNEIIKKYRDLFPEGAPFSFETNYGQ